MISPDSIFRSRNRITSVVGTLVNKAVTSKLSNFPVLIELFCANVLSRSFKSMEFLKCAAENLPRYGDSN